jgi:hypothetical protein
MLGMLGSNQDGERDNAAQLITQFMRKRGLSWGEVLQPRQIPHPNAARPGHRPSQAFQAGQPRVARVRAVASAGDAVWRWSMLFGLTVVGAISLASLLQQSASVQVVTVDTIAGGTCTAGMETGAETACAVDNGNALRSRPVTGTSTTAQAARTAPAKLATAATGLALTGIAQAEATQPAPMQAAQAQTAAPAAARPSGSSFADGAADRKVAGTWEKLAPPGLCQGPFESGQQDYKSACAMAEKLLTQFNQRRRTNPEYRRGWNSVPL